MDPEAVEELAVERADVGSSRTDDCSYIRQGDGRLLDFSALHNAETPDGISQVYESALVPAQSYPPDDYSGFRATAAEYVGCEATEIIPAAGRLAALRLALATTVRAGDDVLVPSPSCSEYAREVRLQGASPVFREHETLLDTDPSEFRLVCSCYPNNPTGHAHDTDRLREYAEQCRDVETPLLLDESFLGFSGRESLAGTAGVITVSSLSVLAGVPGIRVGFLVATGEYRDRLDTARLTWELGTPGMEVGIYCLEQSSFLEQTRERVRQERSRLREQLNTRFCIHESHAPYLLLELPPEESVDTLLATLREAGIAVRDARTFRTLDNHIRVTVRTPDENDKLLAALGV